MIESGKSPAVPVVSVVGDVIDGRTRRIRPGGRQRSVGAGYGHRRRRQRRRRRIGAGRRGVAPAAAAVVVLGPHAYDVRFVVMDVVDGDAGFGVIEGGKYPAVPLGNSVGDVIARRAIHSQPGGRQRPVGAGYGYAGRRAGRGLLSLNGRGGRSPPPDNQDGESDGHGQGGQRHRHESQFAVHNPHLSNPFAFQAGLAAGNFIHLDGYRYNPRPFAQGNRISIPTVSIRLSPD